MPGAGFLFWSAIIDSETHTEAVMLQVDTGRHGRGAARHPHASLCDGFQRHDPAREYDRGYHQQTRRDLHVGKKMAQVLIGGKAITEGLLNQVEIAFWAYGPCFGCATHALPGARRDRGRSRPTKEQNRR